MLAAALTLALLSLPALGAWRAGAVAVRDWRLGLGLGALAWAAWAVAIAELLSLGELLTRATLFGAWSIPALVSLVGLARARESLLVEARDLRAQLRTWTRLERALLAWLGISLGLTLLVALRSAPNNWDSHVYHLARVARWAELDAVRHYPTNIDPQLYQPPGAELLIAHGYVLSGGDLLAALVQWCAYAVAIVLASVAARAMGAARRTQLVAALLVATTPMAILQASSTQNDLVLGMWLLLAATIAAQLWRDGAASRRGATLLALAASLALGLAVLTKGTGLIYALPVGLLLAAATWRRLGAPRTIAVAGAGLVLVALPSAGHWLRMHETYGSLVVSTHAGIENPYAVQDPDLRTLASNLVRNATNHLDLPGARASEAVEDAARRTVRALGADPDDPRTTFLGQRFRVGPFGPHEDHAGSLLLLALGLWAGATTLLARRRRDAGSGLQLAWLGVVATSVLLFCWLLTWQNWHARLHLPVLLLVAVLVAVRLERHRRTTLVVLVLAIALASVALVANVTRPLVGSDSILTQSRTSTYFIPRPQAEAPYREVVQRLADAGVRRAGLLTGVDDWHYALQVLGERAEPSVRFAEVLLPGSGIPDHVVCVSCTDERRHLLGEAGLEPVALEHGGPRQGRGDDVLVVELWERPST